MNVFDRASPLLTVWILLSCLGLILSLFIDLEKKILNAFIAFLLGIGTVLFFYYLIYLAPFYLYSLLGIIVLGVGIHSFIPLLLWIISLRINYQLIKRNVRNLYYFLAGVLVPVLSTVVFLILWKNTLDKINISINQNNLQEGKLPGWVVVSRDLEKNGIFETLIKSGIIYRDFYERGYTSWNFIQGKSFDGIKEHNPWVVIARLVFEKPLLERDDKIKILQSIYHSRHEAQDRLWSGDNLKTNSVLTNVLIYPEYYLAYTEKTLTIQNNSNNQGFWNSEEAIYTFHLPEGSVASSLSLWIDGKEEKSRLTTKALADTAYKEIVGVEAHDPSVVHWQEGNTITVRVFPCTPDENRKFRIGITSPLKRIKNRLIYENPYFEGPEAQKALESVQIRFSSQPKGLSLSDDLEKSSKDIISVNRDYLPHWNISFEAGSPSGNTFRFRNQNYQMQVYKPIMEPFQADNIYLDINQAWSEKEFNSVWKLIMNRKVQVYDGGLIQLNEKNKSEIFKKMNQRNFSLFPLYEIHHPEKSLLITKTVESSPNLYDLTKCAFGQDLASYFKDHPSIRTFNLSEENSPYLKALKELRRLNYTQGNQEMLGQLLGQNIFEQDPENDSTVVIPNSNILIKKVGLNSGIKAPDHLARLFIYNDIMRQVGPDYFKDNYVRKDLMDEASLGYIVSPLSSMIVLEKSKDYDRFNISENKNSLNNASMNASGSVPEPSEWLLIIFGSGFLIIVILKPRWALK